MKTITVHNLGGLPTAKLDEFNELQEDFKISDPDKLSKLQMLIITRGFKYAFKAWKDPDGKLWIIDAHQRRKALYELRKSGFEVPDIPYEPIYAESKKEAVEEIAAYNSEFAKKNPDTLLFKKYEIDDSTLERFALPFEAVSFELDAVQATSLFNDDTDEIIEDSADIEISDSVATQFGDIWLLGRHRLMCGDCREKLAVKKLMDGKLADLCVTDPPYNVAYEGATEDCLTIQNDSMGNDDFIVFLREVYEKMFEVMKPGAGIYVFHADSEGAAFRIAFKQAGFKYAQCLIWRKNTFCIGRQDYQWQHEPILYGWKPGAAHNWFTDRKQTTIWDFDKPQRNAMHPTMKPIALMAYPIKNSCKPQGIVIDFFSGSGSTLMACQQVDRTCHAMEIDPKYAEATVKRYQSLFPGQPIKLIRDGKTYRVDNNLNLLE